MQPCTSPSQTVGADGGTIEVEGEGPARGASLVVPPRALEAGVEITIEPVSLSELAAGTPDADAALTSIASSSIYSTDDLVEGTATVDCTSSSRTTPFSGVDISNEMVEADDQINVTVEISFG